MIAVSPADAAGWRGVSAVLAEAFVDDPVMSRLLPDRARRPAALRRFFAVESRYRALPHGVSLVAPGPEGPLGAALVLPPGHWRAPLREQVGHAPALVRAFGPAGLARALRMLAVMERRHPREPHYYLPFIGTDPSAQGKGIGGALLAALAQRCDREGMPAYLEATSARSAALYRRHGFVGLETVRPAGGPPVERMLRRPSTPSS